MKAIMCNSFGPPESLVLEEVPDPVAGEGQVVIDVGACAVNFPDLLMIQGQYQIKPALPFSPGGEVAGVVSSIGDGVTGLSEGLPVIAYLGHGGLAERVCADADVVVPLSDDLDPVVASSLLYAYGTSYYALKCRGELAPGEALVVLGAAGGVGLAAVELGSAIGAKVIAAASTEEKLRLCREHGASATINYATEDLKSRIRELTNDNGADVVYDAVGGSHSESALRSMAWGGRFLVIGFASGEVPRIPLNLPLLKGCSLVGVFWGEFTTRQRLEHLANVDLLIEWWREGRLRPHVASVYSLDRAAEALRQLAERRVTGKVVVRITPPPA